MQVVPKKPDGRGKWIRTPKKKKCKDCGEEEISQLVSVFDKKAKKHQIQNLCKSCRWKRQAKSNSKFPERIKRNHKLQAEKDKANRKAGKDVDKYIYGDCRSFDKKKGLENDLTREFIREQIAKGCQYCGETDLRMSMDRIDNAIGHVRTNVVPACIRCNYFRRSMPYEAWLVVAEGVRDTRVKGLFGDWTARARTCG